MVLAKVITWAFIELILLNSRDQTKSMFLFSLKHNSWWVYPYIDLQVIKNLNYMNLKCFTYAGFHPWTSLVSRETGFHAVSTDINYPHRTASEHQRYIIITRVFVRIENRIDLACYPQTSHVVKSKSNFRTYTRLSTFIVRFPTNT